MSKCIAEALDPSSGRVHPSLYSLVIFSPTRFATRVPGLFITRVPGFMVSYMKSITNDVVGAEIKVNCADSVYY
jgi:hypothetical protein